MKTFVLEHNSYQNGKIIECNGWWELENNICYNRAGGRHEYYPTKFDKIVEAEDWKDLDYSYLIKKDSQYGWVNPQGDFFGCNYRDHLNLAEWYFKKTERELEKSGWVKIYKDFEGERRFFSENYRLTETQRVKLESLGFNVEGYLSGDGDDI